MKSTHYMLLSQQWKTTTTTTTKQKNNISERIYVTVGTYYILLPSAIEFEQLFLNSLGSYAYSMLYDSDRCASGYWIRYIYIRFSFYLILLVLVHSCFCGMSICRSCRFGKSFFPSVRNGFFRTQPLKYSALICVLCFVCAVVFWCIVGDALSVYAIPIICVISLHVQRRSELTAWLIDL